MTVGNDDDGLISVLGADIIGNVSLTRRNLKQ